MSIPSKFLIDRIKIKLVAWLLSLLLMLVVLAGLLSVFGSLAVLILWG